MVQPRRISGRIVNVVTRMGSQPTFNYRSLSEYPCVCKRDKKTNAQDASESTVVGLAMVSLLYLEKCHAAGTPTGS